METAPQDAREGVGGRVVSVATFLMLLLLPSGLAGQMADSVVLRNGDVIHGEVVSLKRGRLEFDTDAMGEVSVDWDDILHLTSELFLDITDLEGRRHYGRLEGSEDERVLVVTSDEGRTLLPFAEVITMRSVAENFQGNSSGYVDVGTNLARADEFRSVLLQGHASFDGRLWRVILDGQLYQRSQLAGVEDPEEREGTSRYSGTVSVLRSVGGRWLVGSSVQIEKNEELSLERRTLVAAGGGYDIIRNQAMEVAVTASAAYNRERFAGDSDDRGWEAKASFALDVFDLGDLDIYTLAQAYRSLNSDRYRLDVNLRLAWKFADDFTVSFTGVDRFDSAPGAGAARRDFQYGVALGFSWG